MNELPIFGNRLPQQAVPEEMEMKTEITASLSSDKRTVTYSCGEKTAFEYSLTYTGFKEDIVVSEYTGQTEYYFLLNTNGLVLEKLDGSYYLTNGKGEIKAVIGDIIIFTADERNNAFGNMTHETVKEGKQYILTIHIDGDYLKDEKTVYPIRIDPTIEINYEGNGAGAIEDVTLNSLDSSSPNSGSLFVGKRETYGISRTLMRFPGLDLSVVGTSDQIISARVELRDLMCYSTQLPVSCHTFKSTWNIGTVRWSNTSPDNYVSAALDSKTVYYRNGDSSITGNYARYSFNITGAVKAWKNGTYSKSCGVIFKTTSAVETGSTNISVCFASYNRSSNKPSFTMVYSNPYAASADISLYQNSVVDTTVIPITNNGNTVNVVCDVYDDDKLQMRTNCYGYALRMFFCEESENIGEPYKYTTTNGDQGIAYHCYKQQPGEFWNKTDTSGVSTYQGLLTSYDYQINSPYGDGLTTQFVMNYIVNDLQTLGYSVLSQEKYTSVNLPTTTFTNKRLIGLVVRSDDFHFYMQNENGTWSHKPGLLEATTACHGCSNPVDVLTNENILEHISDGYSDDYIFFYVRKSPTVDYCHGDGTASMCTHTPLALADVAGEDYAHAKGIAIGTSGSTTFSGMMDYGTDNDCYAFDATQTETYTIYLTTTKNNGPYSHSVGMQLYTSNGQYLGGGVYSGNGAITVSLTKGEIYYIRLYVINPYFDHWRGYVVNIY